MHLHTHTQQRRITDTHTQTERAGGLTHTHTQTQRGKAPSSPTQYMGMPHCCAYRSAPPSVAPCHQLCGCAAERQIPTWLSSPPPGPHKRSTLNTERRRCRRCRCHDLIEDSARPARFITSCRPTIQFKCPAAGPDQQHCSASSCPPPPPPPPRERIGYAHTGVSGRAGRCSESNSAITTGWYRGLEWER